MSTISAPKGKDQPRPNNQPEGSTMDKAKEMAGAAVDKAKDLAGSAVDKAKELAGAAGEHASHLASAVGHKAEQLTSSAGTGIKHLGETIKDRGPHEGTLGSAAKAVGGTLEAGGKYVEEAGLSGMMDDLTEVIRRNPVPAVLIGLGLGVLLGRTFSGS